MLLSFLLILSCAASVAVCDSHMTLEEKYNYSLVLSSGNYEMYWSFDACKENVSIAVHVKTLGWIGLGVSERGGMENADIVTGRVMNGKAEVTDRFATMQGYPSADTTPNWFLIGGSESDGWTTLEFWRYLDTGDADTDRVITETFNPVIYAWGTTDTVEYHMTRRGSQAVNFVQGDQGPPLPPEAKTFQLHVKNVTIPDKDTTYWCEAFILPEEIRSETKHIIKYNALIHEPANAHVHHMLLYTCDGTGIDSFTNEELSGAECLTGGSNNLDPKLRCLGGNLVAAWAVGASAFYFPENVSFSIGGPSSSRYMVVEMHYDNPTGASGVIDNSGFEFTYLDDARCFDAGVMSVGNLVFPTMVIPPGLDNFDVFGVCDSSCTQNFPAEGITVFANALHTHLAGHGLSLRHYRNGVEITPALDQDINYDFNFQQYRSLTPRKILPGDVLELECNYRSTDRNSTILGGLRTLDEMCLSFLSYYPRSAVTRCESSLELRPFVADLRLDEVGVNLNQSDLSLFLESVGALSRPDFPWDESRVMALSNRYMSARFDDTFHHVCDINEAVLSANFTRVCSNEPEAVTATSTVCTTESPTRIGPTGTTTEFELPTEPGTSGTSGNGAAVMNLSIEILLMMTAASAFLLLA